MASRKDYERLDAVKANRLDIKQGLPAKHEGRNGDLQVRRTTKGLVLFAKFYDRWYRVAKLEQMHRDGGKPIGTPEDKTFGKLNINKKLQFDRGKNSIALEMDKAEAILKVKDTRSTADADIQCANIRDANGNKSIEIAATSSAVNRFKIVNSAAGAYMRITADGDDDDTHIELLGKGEGNIRLSTADNVGLIQFLTNEGIRFQFDGYSASGYKEFRILASATEILKIDADESAGNLTSRIWNVTGGGTGSIYMSALSDLYFNAGGNQIYLNGGGTSSGDTFAGGTTFGYFDFATGSTCKLKSAFNYHLNLISLGSGNIVIDSAADIALEAAGGDITADAPVSITSTTADQFKVLYDGSNYGLINVADDGHVEIESVGTDADMTLKADGAITLNGISAIRLLDDGGTFTPAHAADIATKAYVDSKKSYVHVNNYSGRMSTVNYWYVSNQSLGSGITAADFGYGEYRYAMFNAVSATVITGWSFRGYVSSTEPYDLALYQVTPPADGGTVASSAAIIGLITNFASGDVTANRMYTTDITGLSVSVAAGQQIFLVHRYTDGSGNKSIYGSLTLEFEVA